MIEPVLFPTMPVFAKGLAVALPAAAVFTIDTPLNGGSAVAPTPFATVLASIQARQ